VIKSAVTISLVPEARGGPFVFWDDLPAACRKAAALGFDGIEVFAPDATALSDGTLRRLLDDHGLALAAAGTGAGWVRHKLTLTSPDGSVRKQGKDFVRSIIDAAGALGAPAIIGSMQGRFGGEVAHADAMKRLAEGLNELGEHAVQYRTRLLFEPLNRYETNLVNTLGDGSSLLANLTTTNVRLLADLFHMNIEEGQSPAAALRSHFGWLGHVHLADSNRRPVGNGHLDLKAVSGALRDIRFDGYVSAEALPYPTPDDAAKDTIDRFLLYFR
jgi:sugar phosphate isomerase/epimerase